MNILQSCPSAPPIGLSTNERTKYSIAGYALAVAKSDAPALANYAAMARDVSKITGQFVEGGFLVPRELLTRTMATTPGAKGGYMQGAEVIDYTSPLDRPSLIGQLPLTRHDDLNGQAVVVTEKTQATATWFVEGVAGTTPTEVTYGASSLARRSVFAWMPATLQLLLQSGTAGRRFIDRGIGQALDEAQSTALVQGAGGIEPMGILPNGSGSAGLAGVDTRAGTSYAMSDAAAMLKVSEAYASDDSLVWVAGLTTAEKLRQRVKLATYGNGFLLDDDGRMLGRRVVVSRLMPTSGLILAPWASVHFGTWGAPYVRVDTSTGFNTGLLRIGVTVDCDFTFEAPAQIAVATAVT
jgi:HK97 family phage major capsid protein